MKRGRKEPITRREFGVGSSVRATFWLFVHIMQFVCCVLWRSLSFLCGGRIECKVGARSGQQYSMAITYALMAAELVPASPWQLCRGVFSPESSLHAQALFGLHFLVFTFCY